MVMEVHVGSNSWLRRYPHTTRFSHHGSLISCFTGIRIEMA